MQIDTNSIQHVDVFECADKIDKLRAGSIFSTNEILRKLGEPQIDEPWANEHVLTKNYESVKGEQTENV